MMGLQYQKKVEHKFLDKEEEGEQEGRSVRAEIGNYRGEEERGAKCVARGGAREGAWYP